MSLLAHVAHYFTHTWKESASDHSDSVEVASVRFVGDFLDSFESSLGPYYGAEDEAFQVSCDRSSGSLQLVIPGPQQGSGTWRPWQVGATTALGAASIDLSSNNLSLTFETGDVEIKEARSDIGAVYVASSYDYETQALAASLKVGPLATRLTLTPSSPSAADTVSPIAPAVLSSSGMGRGLAIGSSGRPFLARYNVVSEFSTFFPGGRLSQLPNLRIGVRTSNDPDEAPVVLGCALWAGGEGDAAGRNWSLAGVLSLTSLMHMQPNEHSGVIATYLSSARGPRSRSDDGREDDELTIAGQKRFLQDGSLTASWLLRAPVGPRLFDARHQWSRFVANEVEGRLAVELNTSIAYFPSKMSAAVHRSGSICGGVQLMLPTMTTGLGAFWDPDAKRLKYGFDVSC